MFAELLASPLKSSSVSKFLKYILIGTLMISLIMNGIDIFYYSQFKSRLNALALDYLFDLLPILKTAGSTYPVWLLMVWIGFPASVLLYVLKRIHFFSHEIKKARWLDFGKSFAFCVLFSFIWIGEPLWRINWFPKNFALSQALSFNSAYSLTQAVNNHKTISQQGLFFGSQAHDEKTDFNIIAPSIVTADEELISGKSPFLRKIKNPSFAGLTFRPNIVLILMEGFSTTHIPWLSGTAGKEPDLAPNLKKIADQGILFTNIFSHEMRTHHGVVAATTSLPSLFGGFISRRTGGQRISTVADVLKPEGYESFFFNGFDLGFDHIGIFLKQGGFDRLFGGKESYPKPRYFGEWGASDEDIFDLANRELKSYSSPDHPFFSLILTSSNHAPYVLPPYYHQQHPEMNARSMISTFQYADWSVGKFIENASHEEYFNRTVFVMMADHGEPIDPKDTVIKRSHIPLVIYAPWLVKKPKVVSKIGSQVDVLPTLMHLTGLPLPYHFIGSNLLDEKQTGFAVFRSSNRLWLLNNEGLLGKDLMNTDKIPELYKSPRFGYSSPSDLMSNDSLRGKMNEFIEAYTRSVFRVYSQVKHVHD